MSNFNEFVLEIDRYMSDCNSRNLSQKTMRSYEQTLRLFARYLFDIHDIKKADQVKPEHFKAYFTYLRERGKYTAVVSDRSIAKNNPNARTDKGEQISDTTLANYQRNIKAFFNWLYRERVIRVNPVIDMRNIKPTRKVKALLSENEISLFFRAFDVSTFVGFRDWTLARLILDTGARIGEILAIVPADIDLRNGALLLRETKSGKERFVYFSKKMARNLKSWLEYRERYTDVPYVFPTTRGNRMDSRTVNRSFKRHSSLVGLDVQPHQLRNNFAKYYLLNGGDWATLSRILGHSSIEVTQQAYLDFTDHEVSRKYQQHSPLNNLNV